MYIQSQVNNCATKINIRRNWEGIVLSGHVSPFLNDFHSVSFGVKATLSEIKTGIESIESEIGFSGNSHCNHNASRMVDAAITARELVQYYSGLISDLSDTNTALMTIINALKARDFDRAKLMIVLTSNIKAALPGNSDWNRGKEVQDSTLLDAIKNSEDFDLCISSVVSAKSATNGPESLSDSDYAAYQVAYTLANNMSAIESTKGSSVEDRILSALRPALAAA